MSLGLLIGIGLGSYLPGENLAMNSMIGALAGNVIQNVGDKALGISQIIISKLFTGRYNTVTIERSDDNPIYLKLVNNANDIIEESYNGCATCPICLCSVYDKNIVMTNCKHTFCKECLDSSISYCGDLCPLCRQDVNVKYVLCES